MSIDVQQQTLELPGLLIVDGERRRAAAEFIKICRLVMGDDDARIATDTTSRMARVPYKEDESVNLQAEFWKSVQLKTEPQISYLSLAVHHDHDGAMILSVEAQKLPYIDLRADPFAQGILDYFRAQYN